MISKILVPTDGSEIASKSVKYASDLAKQLGATITLLSVIDINAEALLAETVSGVDYPTSLIKPIDDYLKEAAGTYIKEATRIIINEAVKSKVDLIVMGSQGRSALKAAFLGSVTFGVMHKETKISVLVVRK